MNIFKYSVYVHIFPNHKLYFGITCLKNPAQRWRRDGGGYTLEHQPVMYNAIHKYGWENVKHKILYRNLSRSMAMFLEKYLIKTYNTNCHFGNNGYNMTNGGEGNGGRIVSDSTRAKIGRANLGRTGALCCNSKRVYCDNIYYSSRGEFAQTFNLNPTTVGTWLNGKKGMPIEWYNKNLHYVDHPTLPFPQKKPHNFKIVYNGIEFNSRRELADYIGITPSCLCVWLKNPDSVPRDKKLAKIKKEICNNAS